MDEQNKQNKECQCGKIMTVEEIEFWGECFACCQRLPIHTKNDGDKRGAKTDRLYHGDQFERGEW